MVDKAPHIFPRKWLKVAPMPEVVEGHNSYVPGLFHMRHGLAIISEGGGRLEDGGKTIYGVMFEDMRGKVLSARHAGPRDTSRGTGSNRA